MSFAALPGPVFPAYLKSKAIDGERNNEEFPGHGFQCPLAGGGSADAAALGHAGPDQGQSRSRLSQRSAHLGRRLRSRPRAKAALAEGSRRIAAANDGT